MALRTAELCERNFINFIYFILSLNFIYYRNFLLAHFYMKYISIGILTVEAAVAAAVIIDDTSILAVSHLGVGAGLASRNESCDISER